MKLLQELEDARAQRKSLKPQVERRRRERMNRSLESLKTLLLHRQEETRRRVEKSEILEHTVLFLQSTARGDTTGARGGGGGGQTHSFQDGFSSCLQRAAHFLGPRGKGLFLGAALDASARCARPDSPCASLQRRSEAPSLSTTTTTSSSSSLLLRKSSTSVLRKLMNRPGHALCAPASHVASCGQTRAESHLSPTTPQQPHKVASRASKQSPTQSLALGQALWRPWP